MFARHHEALGDPEASSRFTARFNSPNSEFYLPSGVHPFDPLFLPIDVPFFGGFRCPRCSLLTWKWMFIVNTKSSGKLAHFYQGSRTAQIKKPVGLLQRTLQLDRGRAHELLRWEDCYKKVESRRNEGAGLYCKTTNVSPYENKTNSSVLFRIGLRDPKQLEIQVKPGQRIMVKQKYKTANLTCGGQILAARSPFPRVRKACAIFLYEAFPVCRHSCNIRLAWSSGVG